MLEPMPRQTGEERGVSTTVLWCCARTGSGWDQSVLGTGIEGCWAAMGTGRGELGEDGEGEMPGWAENRQGSRQGLARCHARLWSGAE